MNPLSDYAAGSSNLSLNMSVPCTLWNMWLWLSCDSYKIKFVLVTVLLLTSELCRRRTGWGGTPPGRSVQLIGQDPVSGGGWDPEPTGHHDVKGRGAGEASGGGAQPAVGQEGHAGGSGHQSGSHRLPAGETWANKPAGYLLPVSSICCLPAWHHHLSPPQSYEEATTPLAEDQEVDVDEDFSLHFQLADVKSGLSEVRDKLDDVRMGQTRSRGSRESQ